MKWIALLMLSGCATWVVDMPGFTMRKLEWNHLTGADAPERLARLCVNDSPRLMACAFRIREGGQCVVFSIYTEQDSHRVRTWDGATLYQHEVGGDGIPGHCGIGLGNGYKNHA